MCILKYLEMMLRQLYIQRRGLKPLEEKIRASEWPLHGNCYYIDTMILCCLSERGDHLEIFFNVRATLEMFSWMLSFMNEPQRTNVKVVSESNFLISTHLSPFQKRHRISGPGVQWVRKKRGKQYRETASRSKLSGL